MFYEDTFEMDALRLLVGKLFHLSIFWEANVSKIILKDFVSQGSSDNL